MPGDTPTDGAVELGGREEWVDGECCCDIARAISDMAVVRPAIGVTCFSARPENAGMEGGSSSDLHCSSECENEERCERGESHDIKFSGE